MYYKNWDLRQEYNDAPNANIMWAYKRPSEAKIRTYYGIVDEYDRNVKNGAWIWHSTVWISSHNHQTFTTITKVLLDNKLTAYIKETKGYRYWQIEERGCLSKVRRCCK